MKPRGECREVAGMEMCSEGRFHNISISVFGVSEAYDKRWRGRWALTFVFSIIIISYVVSGGRKSYQRRSR